MPRPLVFGNGRLLVNLDSFSQVRDIFYPRVGQYNHLSGYINRIGIWVDGKYSWSTDPSWSIHQSYLDRTLIGVSDLRSSDLELAIRIEEGVLQRSCAHIRRFVIDNLSDREREVRLFFTHDLRIMESDIGDTALYSPYDDAMVHYKGPYTFLFGGQTEDAKGIYQYSTGIKAFNGLEGSYKDAEGDGQLSMNPISQGSVDSVMSFSLTIPTTEKRSIDYWMICGDSLSEVSSRQKSLLRDGAFASLSETRRYWLAWNQKSEPGLSELPEKIQWLYHQSLLVIRANIDNGGAILAANDSDIMATNRANYSYMWPRDGALTSEVLDMAGYHNVPRRFFEFCHELIDVNRPVLLHKYTADGHLGASWHPWVVDGKAEIPFQEDETALTLLAAAAHYRAVGEIELINQIYDKLIGSPADFLVEYRDPATGLPKPSYDLWEERRGVHTFTVAAVIAGLGAAAELAEAMGEAKHILYRAAAESYVQALREHLYDRERGVFYRRLAVLPDGTYEADYSVDSSCLQVGLLGALPADDPMVLSSTNVIERELWVHTEIGGLARYQGDYYFRQSDQYPGNPWIISTLWLAQQKILVAKDDDGLRRPLELLLWAIDRAETTGVLAEQYHPITGAPLSVSPLTWSHAEFIRTVLLLIEKHRSFGNDWQL